MTFTTPKQLVILSGKGGTGKTSITAGLIHLSSQHIQGVYVDADVDAANLALIIGGEHLEVNTFTGGKIAVINPEICTNCGKCYEVCRFDAIHPLDKPQRKSYQVNALLCDGCGACVQVCPQDAICMSSQTDGEWYHSKSEYGPLFHAELFPAAENTGKLVTTVKQHAKLIAQDNNLPLIIVDGPPGIGCPVISASSGADLALIITEPGVTGIHDLERIMQTLAHFNVPVMIAVNKANIYPKGTRNIKNLARSYGHQVAVEIPFDQGVPKSMLKAIPITKYHPEGQVTKSLQTLWEQIYVRLFEAS